MQQPPAQPKDTSDVPIIIAVGCGCLSLAALLVLIPILIPNFLHARNEALYARRVTDETNLAKAIEAYKTDHGAYPASLDMLSPKYISSVPLIPGSQKPYVFQRPALQKEYGTYDISDDASLSRFTFPTTVQCATRYCYVVYTPALGIQVIGTSGSAAQASVPTSRDGHASVYLFDDFTGDFDVEYRARLDPAPANQSWTTVSIYMRDRALSNTWLAVGLMRGYPDANTFSVYTNNGRPGRSSNYRTLPARCQPKCAIEIRGSPKAIYALVAGSQVGFWTRNEIAMAKPFIQLDAEVNGVGDKISAELVPVRVTARGVPVRKATCAATVQGIQARATSPPGAIAFFGARRLDAAPRYFSAVTGRTGCPASSQ